MWKALSVAEKATYHIEGVVDTKARTRLVAVPPPAAPPAAPPVTLPTAPSNAPTPSTSTQLQLQLAQSLQRMTGDGAVDLLDDVIMHTPVSAYTGESCASFWLGCLGVKSLANSSLANREWVLCIWLRCSRLVIE